MRGYGGIFGSPMAGMVAQQMGPRAPDAMMQQQPAKGDKTKRIIGIIGDALLGLGGQQGVYGPMMAQKRAEERQLEMMQQQRRQGLEDYRYKKLVDLETAQPEMDEFDTAMTRAGIVRGSPEYTQYAREFAERKARGPDPILQGAPLPGGGSYTGPYGGYGQVVGGMGQPQVPSRKPAGPRPQGFTDDQLFEQGRKAVESGAPIEEVFERLKAWGVKVT